ncbi:MAG: hypothetical protein FWF59_12070 [Turicibacter sp.]|nr:hypothetical protein [Turicibacter sp.]
MILYDVLPRAICKYGKEKQTIQTIEELAELQKELTKLLIHGKTEGLLEELVDVYIMCRQIEMIYDIDEGDFEDMLFEKLKRLDKRIKEGDADGKIPLSAGS